MDSTIRNGREPTCVAQNMQTLLCDVLLVLHVFCTVWFTVWRLSRFHLLLPSTLPLGTPQTTTSLTITQLRIDVAVLIQEVLKVYSSYKDWQQDSWWIVALGCPGFSPDPACQWPALQVSAPVTWPTFCFCSLPVFLLPAWTALFRGFGLVQHLLRARHQTIVCLDSVFAPIKSWTACELCCTWVQSHTVKILVLVTVNNY